MREVRIAEDLHELAANLWWTWNEEAGQLWDRVAQQWPARSRARLRASPPAMARSLDRARLRRLTANDDYLRFHRRVMASLRRAVRRRPAVEGLSRSRPIAYFSMEFGVHESLPIFAGGLGILAGDHAKSASDLGLPMVGIGMLYHRGYFRQELDGTRMRVKYSALDIENAPLERVRGRDGKELRVSVELPDGVVRVRAWRARVGQVDLYLLDTDVSGNRPAQRRINNYLYGGSREDRIRQELVVGIGGVRLLAALGIEPSVWHMNEGHVAFLALERLRRIRQGTRLDVVEALEALAADTVFTTHTPVPEGNETFDMSLVRGYVESHAEAAGLPVDEFLDMGLDDTGERPIFSMTVLALRLSRFRNGVSALHGEVARGMWSFLWPALQTREVPIGSVTNGVHMTTWVAPQMASLFDRHVGDDWRERQAEAKLWKRAAKIPDAQLWTAKQELKGELIGFVRERERARLARAGWNEKRITKHVDGLLRPDALTIGFARRFALYKRSALIFRDLKRAARLFGSERRPLQIIFAGKPHPEDPEGRKVFEKVARIAARKEFRGRVVLLENYDTEVCRYMVRGVDVWLNNPRRPLEASGTSGEKVPINGGLNVSILDGWWCEGYAPETGWAFGKTEAYDDLAVQDRDDAAALYKVLEREVIPLYYERDRRDLPRAWIKKLKSSMARLVPAFSSHRMVLDYVEQYYLPAQEQGRALRAAGGKLARELAAWQDDVFRSLPLVHFRSGNLSLNGALVVEVFLGGLDPRRLRCWDEDGRDHRVTVERRDGAGLYRLRIERPAGVTKGGRRWKLRLFPTHPKLPQPQELGLAIDLESS